MKIFNKENSSIKISLEKICPKTLLNEKIWIIREDGNKLLEKIEKNESTQ